MNGKLHEVPRPKCLYFSSDLERQFFYPDKIGGKPRRISFIGKPNKTIRGKLKTYSYTRRCLEDTNTINSTIEIQEVDSRSKTFWIIAKKTEDDIYYLCPKGLDGYMFMNRFETLAVPFLTKEKAEEVLEQIVGVRV